MGSSEVLKTAFPLCIPLERLQYNIKEHNNLHPQWIAGFASGEGYFGVKLLASSTIKTGIQVTLVFQLTQHSRDEQLLKSLIDYFGCGKLYKNRETFEFVVTDFIDIKVKIIPFFEKYPIEGIKYLDFQAFCQVADIIKKKGHLTNEGRDAIIKIKESMNTGRVS